MTRSFVRPDAEVPNTEKKSKTANKKASPQAPQPIARIPPLGKSLPITPRIINPTKGGSSTQRLRFVILASQYVHLVNIDIAARAEDGNDKGQTNHNLSCSHGQDDEDKHLSIR